ncbi:MAG: RNA methyltransferase [Myxococcales bacterium]|nr:RNA methyltransferase [Myxococcales bacterium]
MVRIGGGGPKYEAAASNPPEPEELLLDSRKERIEEVLSLRTNSLVAVLDKLEDTFNMAAVLRTCEGLGVQRVHIIDNPEVPYRPNPKVTQGCEKWLDLEVHRSFPSCREKLKSEGFEVWASAARPGARNLYELEFGGKVALVFGNERHGVSPEVLEACDAAFWIPMRGFTRSLNVSAAVSAALGQAIAWRTRQRGPGGDLSAQELADLRHRFQLLAVKQRRRIYEGR